MRISLLAVGTVAGLITLAPSLAGRAEDPPVVFREEGEASFYGDDFAGKPTASGETFDPDEPTAAHPTLPLGTEVTVKRPDTGEEVQVEVNDRGPHVDGRIIDLSEGAARELDLIEEGVAPVEVEATKPQVEQAIAAPEEVDEVEAELREARKAAAEAGTAQPRPLPPLEPPASE